MYRPPDRQALSEEWPPLTCQDSSAELGSRAAHHNSRRKCLKLMSDFIQNCTRFDNIMIVCRDEDILKGLKQMDGHCVKCFHQEFRL